MDKKFYFSSHFVGLNKLIGQLRINRREKLQTEQRDGKLSVKCNHCHLKELSVVQIVQNVLLFHVIHISITVFIIPSWISS